MCCRKKYAERVFKASNAVWVIGTNLMDHAKLTPAPFNECVFVLSHPFLTMWYLPEENSECWREVQSLNTGLFFIHVGLEVGWGSHQKHICLFFAFWEHEEWMSRLLECLIGRQMRLAVSRDLCRQLTRSSSGVSQGNANMPSPCKDHPSGLEGHIFICVPCLFFACLSNIQLFVAAATASSCATLCAGVYSLSAWYSWCTWQCSVFYKCVTSDVPASKYVLVMNQEELNGFWIFFVVAVVWIGHSWK